MYTQKDLVQDFQKLGIAAGDIVNVHSSMKKIAGPDDSVEGGPATVIKALLEVLGPDGTLLMPVFTHPNGEVMDLKTAPSRLGLITETFRTWPGVQRSNNGTHSVAGIGKHAAEILSGHEDVSPLDANSPLDKMAKMGGKILHLGTDVTSCSLLHVAESIIEIPYQHIGYPGSANDIPFIGTDGIQYVQKPDKRPGDSKGFLCVMELDAVKSDCKHGLIGKAPSLLFDAAILLNATVDLLKRQPAALLCNNPRCAVCVGRKEALKS